MGRRGPKPKPQEDRERIIMHVLAELSAGRPVSRIFREDEGLCNQATFWRWHFDDEELRGKLADARANGVEAMLDKAIDVAETPQLGEIVTVERDPEHQKDLDEGAVIETKDGNPYEGMIVKVRKEDMLGHRKLVVDTYLKAAQMLKPKTYGPKLDLTSGGEKLGLSAEVEAARRRASKNE